jgi:phosphatidylinositol-3-phosphatase
MIVPEIEASQAYKNNGAIILWWDESEGGDTSAYTIPEIIISPDAKGDAYTNNILYTHSSDFLTIQEIFNVGPCLLDACSATDLSDLFKPGWIPNDVVPEPRSILQVTA